MSSQYNNDITGIILNTQIGMEKTIIVIPTYNEAGNIEPLLAAIFENALDVYVLIVDDSSPDGTADVVSRLQAQYPHLMLLVRKEKQGLGVAYRAGFKRALELHPDTKILGMMDADFCHDPKDLPKLQREIADHDMVIGSVYAPGGKVPSYSLFRRLMSRGGNLYCRLMFGYPLTDWTNAFVLIRVSALRKVDIENLPAREFAFVFGIKYLLLRGGASWKDIGVIAATRPFGESKVTWHTIREALIAPIPMVCENRLHIPWQVVKFVISGGLAAVVNLVVLYFFTSVFGLWYEYSLVVGFLFAFITSFSLQKFWTFGNKTARKLHIQISSYLAVSVTGLLINAAALFVLVEFLGLWYLVAQILIETVLAIASFIIYKFGIFRKH